MSKWSKASACLNLLTDELSELTIDQGFPQGFIDYYNEHMEMRRTLPIKSDAPILRRKVMGVRRGGEGPSEGQVEQVAGMRKENAEQMQRMQSKVDLLGSQIRRMTNDSPDSRPIGPLRCYECGTEGHFGRDCPERAKKADAKAVEAIKKEE